MWSGSKVPPHPVSLTHTQGKGKSGTLPDLLLFIFYFLISIFLKLHGYGHISTRGERIRAQLPFSVSRKFFFDTICQNVPTPDISIEFSKIRKIRQFSLSGAQKVLSSLWKIKSRPVPVTFGRDLSIAVEFPYNNGHNMVNINREVG